MKDNDYLKILSDFMRDNNLTQEEMAQRLAVSPAAISRWFSGGHGITRKNQARILFVCGNGEKETNYLAEMQAPYDPYNNDEIEKTTTTAYHVNVPSEYADMVLRMARSASSNISMSQDVKDMIGLYVMLPKDLKKELIDIAVKKNLSSMLVRSLEEMKKENKST